MKLTSAPLPITICLVIGAIVGSLGGSVVVLVPWTILGLAIGALATRKKAAAYCGAAYGFALAYAFMITSYNGQDTISTKLLPFIIFGIIGAICGAILALIAYSINRFRA